MNMAELQKQLAEKVKKKAAKSAKAEDAAAAAKKAELDEKAEALDLRPGGPKGGRTKKRAVNLANDSKKETSISGALEDVLHGALRATLASRRRWAHRRSAASIGALGESVPMSSSEDPLSRFCKRLHMCLLDGLGGADAVVAAAAGGGALRLPLEPTMLDVVVELASR
jgi:hypothetical protein